MPIELGFNRQDLLLFQVDARKAGYKDPEIAAFYTDLRTRFSAIPGVRSASLAAGLRSSPPDTDCQSAYPACRRIRPPAS